MGCSVQVKWQKAGLSYSVPHRFGLGQWEKTDSVHWYYLLYRAAIFLFFWGFFIYDLIYHYTDVSRCYYIIYLTNWTYLTSVLDVLLQLTSALLTAYWQNRGEKNQLPGWLFKTQWFVTNVSHTMELCVFLMYWTAVYPALDDALSYQNVHLHLLTSVYVLVDLMVHRCPRRFLHMWHPISFGLLYMFFSIIYYLCGGLNPFGETGIYPVLDWARPGMTIGVVFGVLFVVIFLHGVTCLIYRFRLHLHARWHGRRFSVSVNASFSGDNTDGANVSGVSDRRISLSSIRHENEHSNSGQIYTIPTVTEPSPKQGSV